MINTLNPRSQQKYRRGEIPGQAEQAQQIIDALGSHYVPRASQVIKKTTMGWKSDNQAPRAPETGEDEQLSLAQKVKPQRRSAQRSDQRAPRPGMHPLVYIGLGMFLLGAIWSGMLAIYASFTLNVSDRWAYGPHHMAVLIGVFGHNQDSLAHPTSLRAFIDHGAVCVLEIPAGDAAKAHLLSGQRLSQVIGWQGDPAQSVVQLSLIERGSKPNILVTVLGPSFGWTFQRQTMQMLLVNSGGSFQPEPQQASG
ncbi:MAG TPA: hypothetical protein VKR06_26480 [Ktedonosporobacter sp.]|nr:hypothetical protein [Ktedonosporobacter sp.]